VCVCVCVCVCVYMYVRTHARTRKNRTLCQGRVARTSGITRRVHYFFIHTRHAEHPSRGSGDNRAKKKIQGEEPLETGGGRVFSLNASFGLLATANASALALFLSSALSCCRVSCMI